MRFVKSCFSLKTDSCNTHLTRCMLCYLKYTSVAIEINSTKQNIDH